MEIISNSKHILNQLIHLINSLTPKEYAESLPILNKSSIGQHIRHIVEFYIELEKGYADGIIDYDNRTRNLELETNQQLVLNSLTAIIGCLQTYNLDKELQIASNYGLSQTEKILSKSSSRREVVYALDHTVHHLAIIKIAIQNTYKHIKLDANIGIAPSTLRNNIKVCAQ